MEIRLKVPKTAISSESCILIEWYVGIGDLVKLNQPLYLIESEKTTIEVPSPVNGTIISMAEVNKEYDVGTEIATIKTEL
ncbi:MAG: dihydrolipoamide acyltransferase [Gammaproteobacteria bacterium]|jgi:pyruvate/2-oxoglutarate dehydrogenase complex dihydrolipoamide acyltransferase (E2) component|nr:dihydrolipoamide acyltransferase [Gammaproteobacteria bacterium]MBT6073684.1 dihydrolipoamide acyltransferase [Gammaproteobacteria bacterium]MBT7753019.1 dihydrolipoamide acyltransferase [Gammaproteobacteria bacterium]|tara:strand:- start:133 stop:372 length:240 start_codon:yes stop_codon:yes gene_type:complete